jgi:hypothetical protein
VPTVFHQMAERQNIPLRTLDDVRAALISAKRTKADTDMARLMLIHGRLTDEAREYVAREYPQAGK